MSALCYQHKTPNTTTYILGRQLLPIQNIQQQSKPQSQTTKQYNTYYLRCSNYFLFLRHHTTQHNNQSQQSHQDGLIVRTKASDMDTYY